LLAIPARNTNTKTQPKHKSKHTLLVLQTREDNHSISLKVRRQNTLEFNHEKNKRPYKRSQKTPWGGEA
jgi:hypothetical protein